MKKEKEHIAHPSAPLKTQPAACPRWIWRSNASHMMYIPVLMNIDKQTNISEQEIIMLIIKMSEYW